MKASTPEGNVEGVTHVTLKGCPSCDLAFADVVLKVKQKKEVKDFKKASEIRVSPEMTAALLAEPGPVAVDDSDLEPYEEGDA